MIILRGLRIKNKLFGIMRTSIGSYKVMPRLSQVKLVFDCTGTVQTEYSNTFFKKGQRRESTVTLT